MPGVVPFFRLGFPSAPRFRRLTLPAPAARRTVLQKVRGHILSDASTVCRHRVSGSLSLPSRGPFHLSFTVLYAIGHWGYLALRGGPRSFPLDSSCPVVLRVPPPPFFFRLRGFHPLRPAFPAPFRFFSGRFLRPLTPARFALRFGLLPFRSPLLRESLLFSSPPAT